MILTYDTAKLDDADLEHLIHFEFFRWHQCSSLASAVPDEFVAGLERSADYHYDVATKLRAEMSKRTEERRATHDRLLGRARFRRDCNANAKLLLTA